MSRTVSVYEKRARVIFASPAGVPPKELLDLAKNVRDKDNNMEYARRLLQLASESKAAIPGGQRHEIQKLLAICTYKSPDQPLAERLDTAQAILEELLKDPTLSPKERQDILGVTGAVHKLRWNAYGSRQELETSAAYYRQGLDLGMQMDGGYTAINAAFVLDLLASNTKDSTGRAVFRKQAQDIRTQLCDLLLQIYNGNAAQDFWFFATLGEVYLGLRDFNQAKLWMTKAATLRPPPWQLESTGRQNARLASLIVEEQPGPEPWDVIKALVGGDEAVAESLIMGKVGLALSGGGFRASFFHIGVLAHLAELDLLRHVEVISCVSGGSILGAFYYLELRKTLQLKADADLDREDYIQIVQRMESEFLKGVQRNIRLRMLMEFGTNARVLTTRRSSMTDRLAVLYDRELYDRVNDEYRGTRRSLSDITIEPKTSSGIEPKESSGGFNPKTGNWIRCHKVPILLLNATTLNTCHNWQFTGTFMGEPPARGIEPEIDANNRLRRMYHDEAPSTYVGKDHKSIVKLSEAVAASAGVPVLFDPLVLEGLYGTTYDPNIPNAYVTRLVDGGNYDNQGVSSLLEQDCSVLLISDACGQTAVSYDPGGKRVEVLQRSNDILMARVREEQYRYLSVLESSHALRSVMYVHLKKGLEGRPVDWLDCPDRTLSPAPPVLTDYNIRTDVQELLAAIRTDLDSFSDAEADALMLSGYLMTSKHVPEIEGFTPSSLPPADWRFRKLEPIAADPKVTDETKKLKRALAVAGNIGFKPWRVSNLLPLCGAAVGLIILALLVKFVATVWFKPFSDMFQGTLIGPSLAIVAGALLALWLLRTLLDKLRYRNSYAQMLVSAVMCLVGWILLRLHLWLIEPFYLRFGPKYK